MGQSAKRNSMVPDPADLPAELVASGWVTPAIEHGSYTALWKSLASG